MRTRVKRFSVAAVALGAALALGGCGTPSSSHVALGSPSAQVGTTLASVNARGDTVTTAESGTGRGSAGAKTTGPITSAPGPTHSATTTATTATTTRSPGGASGGGASTPQSQAPSSPVNQQTLNEIADQLGALGQSLSQATSDLDNPQGDS